jgi:hypothetical protein
MTVQFVTKDVADRASEACARIIRAIDGIAGSMDDLADTEQKLRDAQCLLRSVLCQASTLRQIAGGADKMSYHDLTTRRNHIHTAFGAPGDWGYGTPLGDALRDLYEIEIPRPGSRDDRPGQAPDIHSAAHLETLDRMERMGGGFVQSLAAAWRRADPANHAKLWSQFSGYYTEYAEYAESKGGQ